MPSFSISMICLSTSVRKAIKWCSTEFYCNWNLGLCMYVELSSFSAINFVIAVCKYVPIFFQQQF